MPMKPDMEVLPGFTALDPHAAPPLKPEQQALFDLFTPRHEWWWLLESQRWYKYSEMWRKVWHGKLMVQIRSMAKWWKPTPVLVRVEENSNQLSSITLRLSRVSSGLASDG